MPDLSRSLLELGDGEVVDVACGKCGRSLGRYEIQDRGDGSLALYESEGPMRVLDPTRVRRGVRGPRTGRRRVVVEHHEDRTFLRWRCGCGADIRWSADRIGKLEATRTAGRFTLVV